MKTWIIAAFLAVILVGCQRYDPGSGQQGEEMTEEKLRMTKRKKVSLNKKSRSYQRQRMMKDQQRRLINKP